MADKILVNGNPSQDQSYLTYNIDKNPNVFLSYVVRDKSEDNQIHQQAHVPLTQEIVSFFDPSPVAISNSTIEVQGNLKEKGLYERIINEANIVTVITNSVNNTMLITSDSTNFIENDIIFIQGVDTIPTGNYKIINVNGFDITINCKENILTKTDSPKIYKIEYRWDEMYTTPLGLYTVGKLVTDQSNPIEGNFINNQIYLNGVWQDITNYFYSANDQDLTSVMLNVEDPNIKIQIGDYIQFQIIKGENNISLSEGESVVDGINSEINNLGVESFLFKVLATTGKILSLDKPFPFLTDIIQGQEYKFKIVLLNRGKNTISKNLYENTWEFHEIHRKNLLGDNTNKNYLSYGGVEYLGLTTQIKDFLKDTKTPVILLHFNDKIKDRLTTTKNELELHFPNLLLQGEESGSIFTNSESFYDDKSVGTYSSLILKYPKNNFRTLGYVFNDLRIIVITDEEIVTALSYNSNRNYTLPGSSKDEYEFIINKKNRNKNFNKLNPLTIYKFVEGPNNTVQVIFDNEHNFIDGSQIVIEGITTITMPGNVNLNSTFNVKVLDSKNIILLLPTSDNVAVTINTGQNNNIDFTKYKNSEGICYQKKLDYSYFMTYRIRGKFYNTLPMATLLSFNFETNNKVDNLNGNLSITIPKLTHLNEKGILTGFNVTSDVTNGISSPHYDIIIGTYTFDPEDTTVITGVENLKVIPGGSLYDEAGYQNDSHSKIISTDVYLNTVDLKAKTNATTGDILFNSSNKSYYTFYSTIATDIDVSSNWILMSDVAGDKSKGGWYNNNCGVYDIQNEEQLYKNVNDLFTGNNIWLLGNILFKESINQYRLTIKAKIPANKWNGTTNPTFDPTDSSISAKLISEIAFVPKQLSDDGTEIIYDEIPYIYAKINPPIKKTSTSDISLSLSIDF